ncbi:MAG TPA: glycosyltransferase family 2 protein, partial [Acidobacteriaceae bacterium]|nr:glycosyltransferase family 2 protein [Acidobacteriaceae bacterium]
MAQISVIIVNFNTCALLRTCLLSLLAAEHRRPVNVVIVDNGSTDGSAEMVRCEFPRVAIYEQKTNLGFAAASNLGAATTDAPWLLFLNPDTEVGHGVVDALVDFAATHPRPGIYGGRTVFADGSDNVASCWNAPTPWSVSSRALGFASLFRRSEFFNAEEIGGWRRDSVREVDYVVGCFLLIERTLWERLGGFDTRYWMYGEDCDLCLRATAITGHRPLITPAAEIVHHVGAASADAAERKIHILRSRATLIRRHWPRWQQGWGLDMETLWVLTRVLVSAAYARSGGPEGQPRARRWARIWAARREWRRGWPEAMDRPRKRLGKRDRISRFVGSIVDPRAWSHLLRMVNYWNYAH